MKKIVMIIFIISFVLILYCHLGENSEIISKTSFDENPIILSIVTPANNYKITGDFTVSGIAFSPNEITKVEISIDESSFEPVIGLTKWFTNSYNSLILRPGQHIITVRATDKLYFCRTVNSLFIIEDGLKISIDQPLNDSIINISQQFPLSGKLEGFYRPFRKVEIFFDNQVSNILTASIDNINDTWTYNGPIPLLSAGNHVIHAKVYDAYLGYGNTSSITTNVKIIDSPLAVRILSPENNSNLVYGNTYIRGYAYAEKGIGSIQLEIDNTSIILPSNSTQWSFNWNTNEYNIGYHVIKALITDVVGNKSEDMISISISPISIHILTPTEGSVIRGSSISIQGTASSYHPIQEMYLTMDGTRTPNLTGNLTNWEYNGSYVGLHDRGFHLITAIAEDNIGNISSDNVIVYYKPYEGIYVTNGIKNTLGVNYTTRLCYFHDMLGNEWKTYINTSNPFYCMGGIDLDSLGRIYIVESSGNKIVRIDDMDGTNETILNQINYFFSGGVKIGPNDQMYFLGSWNRCLLTVSNFNSSNIQPFSQNNIGLDLCDIEINRNGDFFFSSMCNTHIGKISRNSGSLVATFSYGTFSCGSYSGIAIDQNDNIYFNSILDNRTFKLDPNISVVLGFIADPDYTYLMGLDIDSQGRIYVANSMGNKFIFRFDDINGNGKVTFGTSGTGIGQFQYPHDIRAKL